jgi:putative FmdB family regulatory protein
MPIYQYRCRACGELTEVWAKMSDPPPAACEHCEAADSMEKMVSRTAFHLKGGGWYAQGYGSSGKAGADRSGGGGSSGGSGDSAASKPASSGSSASSGD